MRLKQHVHFKGKRLGLVLLAGFVLAGCQGGGPTSSSPSTEVVLIDRNTVPVLVDDQHTKTKALNCPPEDINATFSAGQSAYSNTRYDEAETLFQCVINALEPLNQPSVDLSNAYLMLGLVYEEQNQFRAAERAYQKALATDEAALGPDHRKLAIVCNNLGNLYRKMEQPDESDAYFNRASSIIEAASRKSEGQTQERY
jgi:tetratricopeptide (TPR) repeat protein